ncbi:PGF-CTERM-anchored ABC transporter substrate-binding protein [Halanaeroarchaeum sulfurireducens]|uniref:C-terminal cell surface glicoprotein-periplasmic binding protein n=1 Tax=Halanaeroarchaeum sulfurireducens TaxID=1604004 RepID=A0A0F7PA19_9EURY|nr:PGF-CTERM-anchored ABC transporter substrate-binding protein [Halanaeroarchaeum sulfurireducens]AKH97996.1 C-terminal cell surface glicoprotein - periplasmic binding protein [Halanaeroarchaeum sulfurireducens]
MRTQHERGIAIGIALLVVLGGLVGPVGATVVASDPAATAPSEDCAFPVERTDATGEPVTVEEEPETVVTLNPSAAQTMWEIGEREKVNGVSEYATYLEGAEDLTTVGAWSVDVETVVKLDPDLVLAPNTVPPETVEKLRDSGLTVYKFEMATSLADVQSKTRLTGELVGACDAADRRADEMVDTLADLETAVEGEDRPRVLYHMGGGYTAGEGTFIDSIIEAAGGTNVAAQAGIDGYAEISEEIVVEQDPQWIFTNSDIGSVPSSSGYEQTTALEKNQTLVVNANYVSQPAPRTVRPVEEITRFLHPTAYHGAMSDGIDFDESLDSNAIHWRGQEIFVADTTADRDTLTLRQVDADGELAGTLVKQFSFSDGSTQVLDTAEYEPGSYAFTEDGDVITVEDGTVTAVTDSSSDAVADGSFAIVEQTFAASFVDENGDPVSAISGSGAGATTPVRFESNRASYDVVVSSDDFEYDDPELARTVLRSSAFGREDVRLDHDAEEFILEGVRDGAYTVDFTDRDPGTYDFEFEVVDTAVADNASIAITEGEPALELDTNSASVHRGDVAEIDIDFINGATEGTLLVGDPSTDGYRANVSLVDDGDGSLTVAVNTYLAGTNPSKADHAAGDIIWAESNGDRATPENGADPSQELDGLLDTGRYEVAVATENDVDRAAATSDDVETLVVEPRKTHALSTWRVGPGNAGHLDAPSDIPRLTRNKILTETELVTPGDYLVAEISASGLEGLLGREADLDDGAITDDFEDAISPANTSAETWKGPRTESFGLFLEASDPAKNREPRRVDLHDREFETVLYNGTQDTYYAVVDLDEVVDEKPGALDEDTTYDVVFSVMDSRLLGYDESAWATEGDDLHETVSASIAVEEADATFRTKSVPDGEGVVVAPADEQTITGQTTLAPGSEVLVSVHTDGPDPFVKSDSAVEVLPNGTFATEFDFSDRGANEPFEVSVSSPRFEEETVTTEGFVVSPATTTAVPTPTQSPTTERSTVELTVESTESTAAGTTSASPVSETSQTSTPGFGVPVALGGLLLALVFSVRP